MSGFGKQLCSCQCHWDLSWLRFGDTRIAASDVDGLFVVERYGRFLFIETKGTQEAMTRGQDILLRALSKAPGNTVIVLRGEKGWPTIVQEVRRGELLPPTKTSRENCQARIEAWFERANSKGITHGITHR